MGYFSRKITKTRIRMLSQKRLQLLTRKILVIKFEFYGLNSEAKLRFNKNQ